jgi:ribosomal protein S18 acetylase RimI-like enzyme
VAGGGPDPPLPRAFDDEDGRRIRFRAYEPTDRAALVAMYEEFDPTDRAQGLPPVRTPDIESWLDTVLEGPSVLAWDGGRVVGHVLFVPDGDGGHELAIFVHQRYQGAGIGTELLRVGLDRAGSAGVTEVWLLVTHGNTRARRLYRAAGFTVDSPSTDGIRMARRL